MSAETSSDPIKAAEPTGRADLLVGVTGKLDLTGVEDQVRAALTTAFDTLDRLCPDTPKVLLSALAAGADMLAAEVALARSGWRVVAPLPFSPELYRADFKTPHDLERFTALIRHPRVRSLVLESLRDPRANRQYGDAELARAAGGNPRRTLHYEQVGLYIAERCALLLAIGPPDETPGRVGGSARILASRLRGPVDATMDEVRRLSRELLDDGGLAEPRTGPAWRISTQGTPGEITVLTPGAAGPAPFRDSRARADSLGLALRLNAFNRDAPAVSKAPASAVSLLREVKDGLTGVQRRLALRVRISVWGIAALFCAAVLCLELHNEMGAYPWTRWLIIAYSGFAAAAIALFLAVSSLRWQPISEDYRAIAEALRIQMMFWESGYGSRSRRVDLMYLRGLHGPLAWIRDAIGHFIACARLEAPLPAPNHDAASRWITGQIEFFEKRIARRKNQVELVSVTTWFLFLLGLVQALSLSAMLLSPGPTFLDTVIEAELEPRAVIVRVLESAAVIAVLFVVALRFGRAGEGATRVLLARGLQILQTLAAIAAGVVLSIGLCRLAALLPPPPGADHAWVEVAAEKLMMLAVILPAAFAGALRFVAEKLSWEAELQGYERAVGHFKRANRALQGLGRTAPARARRARIIADLATEALRENEAWLLAHRERPLEPVVGG